VDVDVIEEALHTRYTEHGMFSACPRLLLDLDLALVCISGLLVGMLWAWSPLFTVVRFLMECWFAS
jgi:hypothetical protein